MRKFSTVMIIDDSEMDTFLNKMILETMDYSEKIITYTNPRLALNYFGSLTKDSKNDIPEVVFLDINMPFMSGFEFLEEFKKLPNEVTCKVKFYVISSSEDPEDIEKISGYDNIIKYLYKPLNKEDII
jgi:response regulator RpfG family c-di-GMP phosphodiesterase